MTCKKCGLDKLVSQFPRGTTRQGQKYQRHTCHQCIYARVAAQYRSVYKQWGVKPPR